MPTSAQYIPESIKKKNPETIADWEIEKQAHLSTLLTSVLFSVYSFNKYNVAVLGPRHCVRCWLKLNFML